MPNLAEGAASLSAHPVYRYRVFVLEYTICYILGLLFPDRPVWCYL